MLVGKQVRVARVHRAEDLYDTRQDRIDAGAHINGPRCQPDRIDANHRSHPCSQAAQSAAAQSGQRTVTTAAPRRTAI